MYKRQELAVGGFDDIRLGDAGNAVLAGLACIVEGQTSDTLTALRGSYGKVDEQIVINLYALRADSVAAVSYTHLDVYKRQYVHRLRLSA